MMNKEQRYQLFSYMYDEHNLILMETEIDDIEALVLGQEEYLKQSNKLLNGKSTD